MKLHITTLLYIVLLANTAQSICMDDHGHFTTSNGVPLAPIEYVMHEPEPTNPLQFADPLDDAVVQLAYKHAPTRIQRLTKDLKDYPKTIAAKRQYLFTGNPGAGKTTLAQAVAQKAGWSCIILELPESSNEYRNSEAGFLTSNARTILGNHNKCVVVLDEMVFRASSDDKEQNDGDAKTSALLCFLDRLKNREDIVVIGTTNNDKKKLPAPLKSRFNKMGIIAISLPSLEIRAELLNHIFTNLGLTLDESYINKIAKRTNDKSFRDIIDFSQQVVEHAVNNEHDIEQEGTDTKRDITLEDIEAIMATWRSEYHPIELWNNHKNAIGNGIIKSLPIALPLGVSAGIGIWQFRKNQNATTEQLRIANEQLKMQKEAKAQEWHWGWKVGGEALRFIAYAALQILSQQKQNDNANK